MKPYAEAIKLPLIASGTVADGYFGSRRQVNWRFDAETGKTLTIWESGYFTAHIPPAVDITEARWLLENHPYARNCRIEEN